MGYYEVGKKQIVRFYNFLIKFYIVLVTVNCMNEENDYILRLIKSTIDFMVAVFSKKNAIGNCIDEVNHKVKVSEDDLLQFMVNKYISDGKINEAEDMIFEAIEANKSEENFKTAVSFYEEINNWSEDRLSKCNFSKKEIIQGLEDVKEIYKKLN